MDRKRGSETHTQHTRRGGTDFYRVQLAILSWHFTYKVDVLDAAARLGVCVRVTDFGRREQRAQEEPDANGGEERLSPGVAHEGGVEYGTDDTKGVRGDRHNCPTHKKIGCGVAAVDKEGNICGEVDPDGDHVQKHRKPQREVAAVAGEEGRHQRNAAKREKGRDNGTVFANVSCFNDAGSLHFILSLVAEVVANAHTHWDSLGLLTVHVVGMLMDPVLIVSTGPRCRPRAPRKSLAVARFAKP